MNRKAMTVTAKELEKSLISTTNELNDLMNQKAELMKSIGKIRLSKEFLKERAKIRKMRVMKFRDLISAGDNSSIQFSDSVTLTPGGKESKRVGSKCNQYDCCINSSLFEEDKSFKGPWTEMQKILDPTYNLYNRGTKMLQELGELLFLYAYDIDETDYVGVKTAEKNIKDMSKKYNLPDFYELARYIKALALNDEFKYYDKSIEKGKPNMGLTNSIMTHLSFISVLLGYKTQADIFDSFNKCRGVAPLSFHDALKHFGRHFPISKLEAK